MAKPTTEELKAELQEVVNKFNQTQTVLKECEKRVIEITAIIKDRTEE